MFWGEVVLYLNLQVNVNRRASDVNEAILNKSLNIRVGGDSRKQLTYVLPLQQTGSAMHIAPLPGPMAPRGLQPIQKEPSAGPSCMFSVLVMLVRTVLLACLDV